jgi:hypothetical protein
MRKHKSLVMWILSFIIYSGTCYAQVVSSTELIEKAKEYNNKVVEYEGEVVGDVMPRGGFAWVNLNDGKNAIGVFGKKNLIIDLVRYKGGYNHKGDILAVKGVFHRACPEHGGDLDIHINEAVKVKDGYLTPHPVSTAKIMAILILSLTSLVLFILYAFKLKRK